MITEKQDGVKKMGLPKSGVQKFVHRAKTLLSLPFSADARYRTRQKLAVIIAPDKSGTSSQPVVSMKLREQVVYKTALYNHARKASYLYRQTLLADDALRIGDELQADVYLCLLPSCAPAGFALQDVYGGKVICDNVENIDVDKQTVAPVHPKSIVRMANHAALGALFACDKLMTVGTELAKTLERYERPTLVIENYRNYEKVTPEAETLQEWGLPSNAKILFTCGSIVEGFENVLGGLSLLPEEYHLVALSRFPVKAQEDEFISLIDKLGISHRVHLKDFVPYERLAPVAANCHLGLIVNSVENPNASVGLPNRFFDFLAADLPIVATAMPDVARLIDEHGLGEVVFDNNAEVWREKVLEASKNHDQLKGNVAKAKRVLAWENKEQELYDFLDKPKRVTMIGFRDLSRYQRFRRMAKTLVSMGVEVNMLFFSKTPDTENLVDGVNYRYVDSMLQPDVPIQKLP